MLKVYVKTLAENYEQPLNQFLFHAQFNYCPLIWMLHNYENNKKIEHSRERCLQRIQIDKLSSYEKLLEIDGSVSVHHRKIQNLAIEMLLIKHGQSREILTDIFTQTAQE